MYRHIHFPDPDPSKAEAPGLCSVIEVFSVWRKSVQKGAVLLADALRMQGHLGAFEAKRHSGSPRNGSFWTPKSELGTGVCSVLNKDLGVLSRAFASYFSWTYQPSDALCPLQIDWHRVHQPTDQRSRGCNSIPRSMSLASLTL